MDRELVAGIGRKFLKNRGLSKPLKSVEVSIINDSTKSIAGSSGLTAVP
jgi:hypothetical protein